MSEVPISRLAIGTHAYRLVKYYCEASSITTIYPGNACRAYFCTIENDAKLFSKCAGSFPPIIGYWVAARANTCAQVQEMHHRGAVVRLLEAVTGYISSGLSFVAGMLGAAVGTLTFPIAYLVGQQYKSWNRLFVSVFSKCTASASCNVGSMVNVLLSETILGATALLGLFGGMCGFIIGTCIGLIHGVVTAVRWTNPQYRLSESKRFLNMQTASVAKMKETKEDLQKRLYEIEDSISILKPELDKWDKLLNLVDDARNALLRGTAEIGSLPTFSDLGLNEHDFQIARKKLHSLTAGFENVELYDDDINIAYLAVLSRNEIIHNEFIILHNKREGINQKLIEKTLETEIMEQKVKDTEAKVRTLLVL